ncbi:MAG: DUF1573 domain-containing protein [Bacteroides sp.]
MKYPRNLALLVLAWMVTLPALAQPRISSNKETHNFGQIEWKRPVTVDYTITNTGDKPLVLTQVTTSCACSVADWTKSPIAPGEKGTITATFDARALGRFEKSIGIYSNAEPQRIYLKFVGEVVQEVKDFTKTHPYTIGQLRTDCTEFDFPVVHRGEQPTLTFSVVNLSDRPYEPVLMHLPPYLKMEKTPAVLLKGRKGVVKLTLDASQLVDLGLTQTTVYLARFSGDKVSEETEMPVSAILLPDFSKLTDTEKANAPAIQLSATRVDFSARLTKKSKASQDIVVSNNGRSPLHISKLQVFNPAVGVELKNTLLAPGENTKLRVTVRKKEANKKKRPLRLLLISNDPVHPIMEINLIR